MDDVQLLPSDFSKQPVPTDPTCLYCLTDLHPGDHAHESQVDVRQVQSTLEAVARGEGPLAVSR